MEKTMVSFTWYKLQRFRKAYEACEPGKVFVFEGNEYLKEYAGYLIQHLETVFGKETKKTWRRNVPQ